MKFKLKIIKIQNKVISLLHIQDIETAISSQYPKHTNNLIYFPNSRLLHLNHHESKQFHQKTENIQNLRAIVCSFIAGGVFTLAMVPSLCIWLHKYLNPSSLPSQLFTSLNVSNKSITSPICALKFTKSNRHIQSDKIQLFSCN